MPVVKSIVAVQTAASRLKSDAFCFFIVKLVRDEISHQTYLLFGISSPWYEQIDAASSKVRTTRTAP